MYSAIYFKSLFFICLGDVMVTPFNDFLNFPEWLGNGWRIVCTCCKTLRVAFKRTDGTAATIAYVKYAITHIYCTYNNNILKDISKGKKNNNKNGSLCFQTRNFFIGSWAPRFWLTCWALACSRSPKCSTSSANVGLSVGRSSQQSSMIWYLQKGKNGLRQIGVTA